MSNTIKKGKTVRSVPPNYDKKLSRLGPEGAYKRQEGKQETQRQAAMSVSDPTGGGEDRFRKGEESTAEMCPVCQIPTDDWKRGVPSCPNCGNPPSHYNYDIEEDKALPDKINKFVAKSEKNIFGDMNTQEENEFYVEGDPDKINYLGLEPHKKGKVEKSIKKSCGQKSINKGKAGFVAGGALGTGLGSYLSQKYGGKYGVPKSPTKGALLGGAIGSAAGSMAQEKLKRKKSADEEDLDKSSDDTPLYTIKSKSDVKNVKKWRPSKGAGAAIGAGLGAALLPPIAPLAAAGGAYLGHKLGKSVKKSVPGWELPAPICPHCGANLDETNILAEDGMSCGMCAAGPMKLHDRIRGFVERNEME